MKIAVEGDDGGDSESEDEEAEKKRKKDEKKAKAKEKAKKKAAGGGDSDDEDEDAEDDDGEGAKVDVNGIHSGANTGALLLSSPVASPSTSQVFVRSSSPASPKVAVVPSPS